VYSLLFLSFPFWFSFHFCLQLAATIYVRQKIHPLNPYASNWLERLRRIKQIRERVVTDKKKFDGQKFGVTPLDDFNDIIQ